MQRRQFRLRRSRDLALGFCGLGLGSAGQEGSLGGFFVGFSVGLLLGFVLYIGVYHGFGNFGCVWFSYAFVVFFFI